MARISPLPNSELGPLGERFDQMAKANGYVPNSLPTMARVPGLAEAFGQLAAAVMSNPKLPASLLHMTAHIASTAAGCRYCQAHSAHNAEHAGVSKEKLGELWSWETSEHFDESERAALRLAFHAASVPNAVTDELIDEVRAHFDDDQITGLVAVVSMFGFLNRWNDTMATDLEDTPHDFAHAVLTAQGWDAGAHR